MRHHYSQVFNTCSFCRISKVDFSSILRTDFDDIKTVCGSKSYPFTVLISSNSVAKIGEKSTFEILQKEQKAETNSDENLDNKKKTEIPQNSEATSSMGTFKKVGRNELCPCGSGKKFKHCHGKAN